MPSKLFRRVMIVGVSAFFLILGESSDAATKPAWDGQHWQYIGYIYSGLKTYVDISMPPIRKEGARSILLVRTHGRVAYMQDMKMILFVDCDNADATFLYGPIYKESESPKVTRQADKVIREVAHGDAPLTKVEERLYNMGHLSPIQRGTVQAFVYSHECHM